jgi:hypothetical protein
MTPPRGLGAGGPYNDVKEFRYGAIALARRSAR